MSEENKTSITKNPFQIGKTVGGCEITDFIGEGGMGTVYQGRQLSLGRMVAIKVLAARHIQNRDLMERFRREARTLAEISHHNIVTIFDLKLEEEIPYIVMEHIDGISLETLRREKGVFPVKEAVNIAVQICDGLIHAHEKGTIHRDLKPANILIAKNGNIKLVDFGLAGILRNRDEERVTSISVVMGTPDYMAPEQKQSTRDANERSDLYSLGVILFQLLTGKLPAGRFSSPYEINPQIPERLSNVIMDLLSYEAEKRPASAARVRELLIPWSSDGSDGAGSGYAEVDALKNKRAAEVDRISRFAFLAAFATLLTAYVFSFQMIDIRNYRPLHGVMRITGVAAIILGWIGLQRIRSSEGNKKGTRFALFGMLLGSWILWIFWLSSHKGFTPGQLLISRLPVTAGILAVFSLIDWLMRSKDEIGTMFTKAGGLPEKFAWLAIILLPSFFLVPFIEMVEPEFDVKASLFQWLSIALGPMIYLLLIVTPAPKKKNS